MSFVSSYNHMTSNETAPQNLLPLAPEQTVAQTVDVAALTDLSTKALDLANTVSHLPLIG